jgi:hypothetical protein
VKTFFVLYPFSICLHQTIDGGNGGAFTTSVAEIHLDEGAVLKHGLMQLSAQETGVHMKTTLVQQVGGVTGNPSTSRCI